MPLHINYLENVKGIRFAISYSGSPQNPNTLAEDSLLKANLKEMGVKIEPGLSTSSGSFPYDFEMVSYSSTNLCYIVKADSFSSIEEIKSRMLKGFNQHVSTSPYGSSPKNMEYIFTEEYSQYPDGNEEKLGTYLETRSKKNDLETVPPVNNSSAAVSSSSASFFNSQMPSPVSKKAEQKSNQSPCCTIL